VVCSGADGRGRIFYSPRSRACSAACRRALCVAKQGGHRAAPRTQRSQRPRCSVLSKHTCPPREVGSDQDGTPMPADAPEATPALPAGAPRRG
jgi:hypothetical protein